MRDENQRQNVCARCRTYLQLLSNDTTLALAYPCVALRKDHCLLLSSGTRWRRRGEGEGWGRMGRGGKGGKGVLLPAPPPGFPGGQVGRIPGGMAARVGGKGGKGGQGDTLCISNSSARRRLARTRTVRMKAGSSLPRVERGQLGGRGGGRVQGQEAADRDEGGGYST